MSSSFLVFVLVGKVFIFLGDKFAQSNHLKGFIGRLLTCGLCSGFWIYSSLSFLLGIYIFEDLFSQRLLEAFITGAVSSLLVHIFSAGWNSLFSTIVIE